MSRDVAELERPLDAVPDDWCVIRLGDVSRSFAGGTPSRSNPAFYGSGIPWLKSGEVRAGRIFEVEEQITEAGLRGSSARIAKAGSPVIAMYGATAGVAGILEIDAALNQAVLAIEPEEAKLDREFCLYLLSSEAPRLLTMTQGSGQPNLSKGLIDGLNVALPPLNEQRRIAEVLRSVDEAIAAADAVARQWETVFAALLEAAFTEGEPSSLDDLCSLIYRYPGFYGFDQLEEGVPVIRGEHLRAGRISTDWTDFYFVDPKFSARFPKTILQLNDVVMSVRGTVGTTAVVDALHVGSQISPNLIRLVANPAKIIPPLLYYAVQSAVAHMRRTIVNAQALPAINAGDLKQVEIALPSLQEQTELLATLNGAAEATAQAAATVRQARATKATLMSDLLSGRVRVPA